LAACKPLHFFAGVLGDQTKKLSKGTKGRRRATQIGQLSSKLWCGVRVYALIETRGSLSTGALTTLLV